MWLQLDSINLYILRNLVVNQDFVQKGGAILEGGEVANIGITYIVENICKQTITNYRSNYASLKEFLPIPENIV